MKRILDSSGKQSKIRFDIELNQQKYYFRGDVVQGRILLESPKPIKVKNIRMQWLGRVRVQLEPTLRDERELFKETTYLDLPETESASETARRELVRKAATSTLTGVFLVPNSPSKSIHYVEADKLYTYPFSFAIPENTILPSCTESETNVGGIIEYIIEACLERPTSDFSSSIKTQILVPILQRIDTARPELMVPQSVQVECRNTSKGEKREEGIAILTASVQKKAFIRNQPVAVTVEINHFEPFNRKQSLTIALVRTCRIVCKGASYTLPDSVIHSIKADINLSNENNLTQTIVRSILVPRNISPTIGVNARLIETSYKIRVRAQLQEDGIGTGNYNMSLINFPADFQSLALLNAEVPIEIGTLPMSDTHIPSVPLNPQFINYFDSSSPSPSSAAAKEVVESQEEKNNLTPTTAEKVHMLKKMQNMMMFRRSSSSPQIDSSTSNQQLDSTEQNMPMTKNDLLTLFDEASTLKGKDSLKSNKSDESGTSRHSNQSTGGTTTSAGAHSSMSTFISSTSEQSQKMIFPPPPTSSPPTIQHPYHHSTSSPATNNNNNNNNNASSIPPSFRLSLGPEFSATVLNSVLNEKPQQVSEEPIIRPSTSSTTNINSNNKCKPIIESKNPITFYNEQQFIHHEQQRRRINSDSIILDAPRQHHHDNKKYLNNTETPSSSSSSSPPPQQRQQQQKPHELTSSKSSGAIGEEQGGVTYFYMFPDSSSSEEEEYQEKERRRKKSEKRKRKSDRKQQDCRATTTTAAGFEKPNSVSGVDVNEARIERLAIVRKNNNKAPSSSNTPYPVTHVDKPDELTASDTDMSLSSDEGEEQDLLDVLQRRDQKIASRMSRQ